MSKKPNLSGIALGFRSSFPVIKAFTDRLDFGKYKGFTIEEVIDLDPSYILWMSDNKKAKFSNEILEAAQEAEVSERFDEMMEDELRGIYMYDYLADGA